LGYPEKGNREQREKKEKHGAASHKNSYQHAIKKSLNTSKQPALPRPALPKSTQQNINFHPGLSGLSSQRQLAANRVNCHNS